MVSGGGEGGGEEHEGSGKRLENALVDEGLMRGDTRALSGGDTKRIGGNGPGSLRFGGGGKGYLHIERYFSTAGESPSSQYKWTKSDVDINDDDGKVLFTQRGVEFPEHFSPRARKIVTSRYFYGKQGTPERENSLNGVVDRVTSTISRWGVSDGYFSAEDGEVFKDELTKLILEQKVAFNSPVWFNVGIPHTEPQSHFYMIKDGVAVPPGEGDLDYAQTSACFIQSVQDDMGSIMELARSEAMLFKFGSGTGTDLSTLRSHYEELTGGGKPSGPLSFMGVYDRIAAVVQSGGKTRRAAKMQSVKDWHPDVMEFIEAKRLEEDKARALVRAGYLPRDAAKSVDFQNLNLSIRVSAKFLKAAREGKMWQTLAVSSKGLEMPSYNASEMLEALAYAAWDCGDPGVQYETAINLMHTCADTTTINASNPCSEYMFIDDSSCNLASHNLRKYQRTDGSFDAVSFAKSSRIVAFAQDILYGHGLFPKKEIAQNSHDYRPLGQGHSNVGALLMSLGLPYDSDEARALVSTVTALLNASVYSASAEMAEAIGPFKKYPENKNSMMRVIRTHDKSLEDKIDRKLVPEGFQEAYDVGKMMSSYMVEHGEKHGFRNAQATVLAPTGTISFMMDCDTLGIEPDIALVKYKHLAEGGILRIVNETVREALEALDYSPEHVSANLAYVVGHEDVSNAPHLKSEHQEEIQEMKEDITVKNKRLEQRLLEMGYDPEQAKTIKLYARGHETMDGAPHIRKEHLPVFDCSQPRGDSGREIHWRGHVKMLAAAQRFLSGAISKTVNMPKATTPEEVKQAILEGEEEGLKALALYRDGSKVVDVYSGDGDEELDENIVKRIPMPATSFSLTQEFNLQGHNGELVTGFYPHTGNPGKVAIRMEKGGKMMGGLLALLGDSVTIGLQHAVPLEAYTSKLINQGFQPSGLIIGEVGLPELNDVREVKSILDYFGKALPIIARRGQKAVGALENADVLNLNGDSAAFEMTPSRKKLPEGVIMTRYKFGIKDDQEKCHEGYFKLGFYPDTGKPGEVFLTMSRMGATVNGLAGGLATSMSIGLQYGVPWTAFKSFAHHRFEPFGELYAGNLTGKMEEVQSIGDWIGKSLPFMVERGRKMVDSLKVQQFSLDGEEISSDKPGLLKPKGLEESLSVCPECSSPLIEAAKGCQRTCSTSDCSYIDNLSCGS